MGIRMDRRTEPRKLDEAEVVFGSGMIGIDGGGIFLSRGQSAFSEGIPRLMSTLHLSALKQNCLAIVGPPERLSEVESEGTKRPNTRRRVKVFSDRTVSNRETQERSSRTEFGRLNTLVCSGQISRILLTTPVIEI
jgi:hypothetical protein